MTQTHINEGAGGLIVFDHEDFGEVRTVLGTDGEPWFVAKDVCEVLGYAHTPHAVRMLDADERGVCNVDTLGGPQNLTIINESGLYSLILRSRKSEAKRFKKWVTKDVLPSIRKHGAYLTENKLTECAKDPQAMTQLVKALQREHALRLEAEKENEELDELATILAPKAVMADVLTKRTGVVFTDALL